MNRSRRKLRVSGSFNERLALLQLLRESTSSKWSYHKELTQLFSGVMIAKPEQVACFTTNQFFHDKKEIVVWLYNSQELLEIVNVTTKDQNEFIEIGLFNEIIFDFEKFILAILPGSLKLEFTYENPSLDEFLGFDSATCFRTWYAHLDKENVNNNPEDFERWIIFLKSVAKDKRHIYSTDFLEILKSNTSITDRLVLDRLVHDFSYGLELLRKVAA